VMISRYQQAYCAWIGNCVAVSQYTRYLAGLYLDEMSSTVLSLVDSSLHYTYPQYLFYSTQCNIILTSQAFILFIFTRGYLFYPSQALGYLFHELLFIYSLQDLFYLFYELLFIILRKISNGSDDSTHCRNVYFL